MFFQAGGNKGGSTVGGGSPWAGISLNQLCRTFSNIKWGGLKARVTEIGICASFPKALIFLLLRDSFSKAFLFFFLTAATFNLFFLVLVHSLSWLSQRNIGMGNFYHFQYWILLHDVIAVSATTQFPPPQYIPLELSYC